LNGAVLIDYFFGMIFPENQDPLCGIMPVKTLENQIGFVCDPDHGERYDGSNALHPQAQ
jgi:hypothetical protein